jgi:hypothetical protein
MAVVPHNAEPQKPDFYSGCSLVARRAYFLAAAQLLVVVMTGCQSPTPSNAPMYGQSTISPPGTANTAIANPGAYAMSAPPMPNTSVPNGWGAPPMNSGAPANTWNSPSIFGSSAPAPVNATSWNPSQPPNAYGASGSIFDQAPRTQQQGIFDSMAMSNASHPGNFNPNSMYRGYESPNTTFTSGTPIHSASRSRPSESDSGSWWDRLTGTQSTVPAAGNPGWNQPGPMSAPNQVAWNDPRNPNYARPPIPNPNAVPNNGWNITSAPAPYAANPLSTAPNYTNYGAPVPSTPNSIARTLPASTNPMRPTNTLPAGWSNGGAAAPAATSVPATGPIAVRNLEDLPPAR